MTKINSLKKNKVHTLNSMKLLYISSKTVNSKTHGGFQGTNRNYLSFCELLGSHNVEVLDLSSELQETFTHRFVKWSNYLRGYWPGVSNKALKKIMKIANEKDFVFIDSSQYGVIAYYLKKANYKGEIISFFHNVEYNIGVERFKLNPLDFWKAILVYHNEKLALKYSDKVVALNTRDNNELKRIYNAKATTLIPSSFVDVFEKKESSMNDEIVYTSVPATCLFIGNNWHPTIDGLKWFLVNVIDHVNIKLQIVGNDMDKLKKNFKHPKIEFLGFVPDISTLITKADYMISPIFKGSGMKIKTCEALMYGKNIIATKEAFEGYEIDYEKVGAMCNTKEEFIYVLNNYASVKRDKFNKYSRQYFLESYSFQATLKKFEQLLSS